MIERFVVGDLLTNCYVFVDTGSKEAVVIDPGEKSSPIDVFINLKNIEVVAIVNTHCHFDHVGGNSYYKEKYGAPLAIGCYDADCLERAHLEAKIFGIEIERSPKPDIILKDGDTLGVGLSMFKVIHTPGHTPGSICLYEPTKKILFSGDTLFFESVGRWDLPSGDHAALMDSIKRLLELPEDVIVYPGHGEVTQIGYERIHNPFVK